jgi:uncharacterized OB-fold protein
MIGELQQPKQRIIYFRFCNKCGNRFNPTGRTQKVCEKCQENKNPARDVNSYK